MYLPKGRKVTPIKDKDINKNEKDLKSLWKALGVSF